MSRGCEITLARAAMGTRFELAIARADAPSSRWASIGESALDVVSELHDRLNRFDRRSLVARINDAPVGEPIAIDQDLADLLAVCAGVSRASGGAFDAGVGTPGAFRVEPGMITRLRDDARLDFGAVAKGVALDLAGEELRAHGVTSALIHGGTSSVLAIGAPPASPSNSQPEHNSWAIRLDGPSGALTVHLRDAALSVSRSDDDAPQPGHVIDPRTGLEALGVACAGAIAPSAALTDAWSTALQVLGERPPRLDASVTTIVHPSAADWRIHGHRADRVTRRQRELIES